MAGIKQYPLPWTTVFADTTSESAQPASGWMGADQFAKLRGTFELRAKTGNIEVAIGYQTANVENSPDAHTVLTAYATTATVTYPTAFTDVGAATNAKQLFRFVWVCKLTAGTVLTMARVAGSVDVISD